MKTCLIKLPNVVNEPLIPDLGLGILVALLRSKGVDIYQADLKPLLRKSHELHTHLLNIRRDSSKKYLTGCSPDSELLKLVDKLLSRHRLDKFDLLGFSLDVESNLFPNLALIKAIKGKTGAKILLGGTYRFSKVFLEKYNFIDYIIIGDATLGLNTLIDKLEKKDSDLSKISGLMHRKEGKIIVNPYLRQMGNVDIMPDFTDLTMQDYLLEPQEFIDSAFVMEKVKEVTDSLPKTAILPLHFIKGCPNSCTFCFWNREKFFRVTNPDDVAQSIVDMKKKYKINNFLFLNNSFNPTTEYGLSLMKAFEKHDINIQWSDSAHPGTFDNKMYKLLKDTGCRQLYLGIESASQHVTKILNRECDVKTFEPLLSNLHSNDIFSGINFFVGLPYETPDDIGKTEEFIKKTNPYFEYFNINLLRLIPEFPLIRDPVKCGITLRESGSMELRNPDNNPEVRKVLEAAGIHPRVKFHSFDEVRGLKWKEKNAQDIKHLIKLNSIIDHKKKFFFENLHKVFFLSRVFDSKKDIMKWYDSFKGELSHGR